MSLFYSPVLHGFASVMLFLSASAALAEPLLPELALKPKAGKFWVYVGTYTGDSSKGIYRFVFDPATGELTDKALAGEVNSPSFLAIHPSQKFLYSVNEIGEFEGKKTGGVTAFAIDLKSGDLKLLNQQSSGGPGPCHLTVDKQGKNVLAANYNGGSVCALPINAEGKLAEASAFIQHKGTGFDKDRQDAPHAHSINLDAANQFAFAADLGLDKVFVYKFDPAKGTLTANDPAAASVAPGSGPRHFAFHPNGRHAYVINELKSTVTAFDYDPKKGELKEVQTISTLPEGYKGNTTTAEVVLHPSGKFLYGSNRGHDSIAIFSVDAKTGKLTVVGHQGKDIKIPRNFVIDPTGGYLLVANQDSDSIVVFRIDPNTGDLTPTGHKVEVGKPVCLRMIRAPGVE
jgi:6-phosphogluconolactonase